ncbi:E3 ubiquitin-protein ligase znrf2 isoform X1 [Kryptolebias marmoratus]|uniref:E3 ubiquitin-protein ligase znrf2 isoform X1 n=1 Tax=Kryptolebias marmoratus TaxID=37003 RepID=UPI0007F911FA|nr:E3 ubiquitin-protein ligase znrf2 isoform X1 [Kryptolebias marmoratus]
MGAKQSSPVFDGRTRAYSSSDLPSSANPGAAERIAGFRYTNGPDGPRIRYTGGGGGGPANPGLSIPAGGRSGSHNQSLDDTDGDEGQLAPEAHRLFIGSLPSHLSPRLLGGKQPPRKDHPKPCGERGVIAQHVSNIFISSFPCSQRRFHCPVCSRFMAADEIEKHLLMCFSKTRLTYNKDILSRDSGECSICLDELEQGDTIARLPCLCIYHKGCIDEWFEVNRSCPEHPAE